MQKKQTDEFLPVLKEAEFFLQCFFKKHAAGKTGGDGEAYARKACEEVAQAIQNGRYTAEDDIEITKENFYGKSVRWGKDNFAKPDTDEDYLREGALRNALVFCKKQGVFPYYLCGAMAAALHCAAWDEKKPIPLSVIENGMKRALAEKMGLQYEPEIVYWIFERYIGVLKGKPLFEEEKKVFLLKAGYEEGFKNEAKYGVCPQCLIKAYFTVTDKLDAQASCLFKACSSLSGGVAACNDGTCGAFSAANMVIGTLVGRELEDLDREGGKTVKESEELGRKVHDAFIDIYGSTICNCVHSGIFGRKFDFRDPKDMQAFNLSDAHADKCCGVVGITLACLLDVLYEEGLIGISV